MYHLNVFLTDPQKNILKQVAEREQDSLTGVVRRLIEVLPRPEVFNQVFPLASGSLGSGSFRP